MKEKKQSFFVETISFESPLSYNEAKTIIKAGTSEADHFFDENIMFGTIIVDKIDAKINNGDFYRTNARTQVKGTITKYEGRTRIHLQLKPNQFTLAIIGICAFFALLPIFAGDDILDQISSFLLPLFILAIILSFLKLKLPMTARDWRNG